MISNIKFSLKVSWYFLRTVLKEKPVYFVVTFLQIILKTGVPFINIVFPKLIIDELLGNKDRQTLVFLIFIMFLLNFIIKSVLEGLKCANENYGDVLSRYFEIQMGKKAMSMDFQHTEDTELLQQKEKANSGIKWHSGGVEGLVNSYINLLSSFFTFIGVVTIVFVYAPYLFVLILLTVIFSSLFQNKINEIGRQFYDETSTVRRVFEYVFFDLPDFRHGKDIRLFHASDMVLEKGELTKEEGRAVWQEQAREENRYSQFQNALSFIVDVAMYFYIGFLALTQRISIATFSMLITSATTLYRSMNEMMGSLMGLKMQCQYLGEYILFMEYPDRLEKNKEQIKKGIPYTFEFKNVGFRYPNGEDFILRNVNLVLHPEERISIVGLNGAGKTTFVKLLTRLYDVSEGEILLNGVNIKEYDYKEYQNIFSVVFQDFKLFALSLKENVETDLHLENGQIENVLQKAGLEELIEKLPNGLDTSIYKFFDETGIEPSGGEAQKIAIARALAKNTPIVILDEPTSALDPLAEYDIYHRFNQLIEHKTAVYISHRLSSCRFSNHILVFHNGTMEEYGTHDELVHKENGIYANMFETQAQYYLE